MLIRLIGWDREVGAVAVAVVTELEVFVPTRELVRRNVHVLRVTVEVAVIHRTFHLQLLQDVHKQV